jgi:hypothetical protein
MSRLADLRSRLAALGRRRFLLRLGAGWCAVALIALWSLAAAWAIDSALETLRAWRAISSDPLLDLVLRAAVLFACLLVLSAALWRYVLPCIRRRESILELALLVERQQKIDSDLVAALQFESPSAASWGSPQLQAAVIDCVAEFGRGLNVFEGLSFRRLTRLAWALGATLVLLGALAALFPGHAIAFARRFVLSAAEYPTSTQIVALYVNGRPVTAGQPVRAPYGRPVEFVIQASGELPVDGLLEIRALQSGQFAVLPLQRADGASGPPAVGNPATENARSNVSPEPSAASLRPPRSSVTPPTSLRKPQAKYTGRLSQLVDPVRYQVFLGDDRTAPARIDVISLPRVDVTLEVEPPEYTAGRGAPPPVERHIGARQIAVLEGSRVTIRLRANKSLHRVELSLGAKALALQPDPSARAAKTAGQGDPPAVSTPAAGQAWILPPAGTPLETVAETIQYSIQVRDEDGLALESPVQGAIRLKPDRPPKAYLEITTKQVLPNAQPNLWYGASDDYGLAELNARITLQRPGSDPTGPVIVKLPLAGHPRRVTPLLFSLPADHRTALDKQQLQPAVRVAFSSYGSPLSDTAGIMMQQPQSRWQIVDTARNQQFVVRYESNRLNVYRQFPLDLSRFSPQPGDQVRVELEATDYRGQRQGKSTSSEPVVFQVTDERGVLAAMVEADQRSAQQLNTIIQRQLGIGDAP